MNTIAVLALAVLAVSLARGAGAEYSVTGNIWGDKECPEEITNVKAYVKTLTEEWEDMVRRQDAENMVKKYTENSLYVYKENGIVKEIRGREDIKKTYQKWYNSGIRSAEVTPVYDGWLADGFLFLTADVKLFDQDSNVKHVITDFVIFKQVGCGFETHMVAQMNH